MLIQVITWRKKSDPLNFACSWRFRNRVHGILRLHAVKCKFCKLKLKSARIAGFTFIMQIHTPNLPSSKSFCNLVGYKIERALLISAYIYQNCASKLLSTLFYAWGIASYGRSWRKGIKNWCLDQSLMQSVTSKTDVWTRVWCKVWHQKLMFGPEFDAKREVGIHVTWLQKNILMNCFWGVPSASLSACPLQKGVLNTGQCHFPLSSSEGCS